MIDMEKVSRIIDELIFEAHKEPTWKAENALKCLKKELLKEHEAVKIEVKKINNSGRCGRCPNCLMELNEMDYPYYCGFCGKAVRWE